MLKRIGILFFLTLLLCLSLGCGLSGLPQIGGSSETVEASEAAAPTTAEDEVSVEDQQDAQQPDDELQGQEIDLTSVTSGLDSLDSYSGTFVMTFTDLNNSATSTYEMDIESVRDPLAQRLLVRGDAVAGDIEMIRIGDKQYIVMGEGQCLQTSAGDEVALAGAMFQPDAVIGGMSGVKRVLPDQTVNGVLCEHYVFDENAWASGLYSNVQGDMWVAVDGGYVVKYSMEADGKSPLSSEQGRMTVSYEIRSINQPLVIEPPSGCADIAGQYPMLPDALDVTSFGESLIYKTSSAIADVIAFYRDEMTAIGWTEGSESFISDETAMLQFTQGDQSVTVTISPSDDGSVSVMVTGQ